MAPASQSITHMIAPRLTYSSDCMATICDTRMIGSHWVLRKPAFMVGAAKMSSHHVNVNKNKLHAVTYVRTSDTNVTLGFVSMWNVIHTVQEALDGAQLTGICL